MNVMYRWKCFTGRQYSRIMTAMKCVEHNFDLSPLNLLARPPLVDANDFPWQQHVVSSTSRGYFSSIVLQYFMDTRDTTW
jgi:hypothetical protein